ncbi:CMRF35-like molecule 7 isoform X1 [Octodon degus]|uniref:CMRF35-like molecule 7 isoform X1 n=1 Tax=Octodon degus TaxID=10160 RepID=A0A6P6EBT0_OCTDE|nr:CMRF35-like molecule 7 isoform X1 [Octodon degus]
MWLPPAMLLLSLPGCFSLQGPESVRGSEGGSVTVRCRYKPRWKIYNKWWCRGAKWHACTILVKTRGSEQEEKSGRVSIRDNQRDWSFEVTMKELRQDDADTYWCGIEKTLTDDGTPVKVTVDPVGTVTMSSKPLDGPSNESSIEVSLSYTRTHYLLLAFVKVPILLALVGVVLWMKESQRVPKEQWGHPLCKNLNSELLTKDIREMDVHRLPTLDPVSDREEGCGINVVVP